MHYAESIGYIFAGGHVSCADESYLLAVLDILRRVI